MTADQLFWLLVLVVVAVVVVSTWLIYWVYRARLLGREERRLMIEKGMALPAPPVVGWPAVKAREQELRFEERRRLIEKGMQPGNENVANILSELLPERGPKEPEHHLRRGLAALSLALGLAGAYVLFNLSVVGASEETRNWFLFFAVMSSLIGFYGLGRLVYYALTRNKPREQGPTAPGPGR